MKKLKIVKGFISQNTGNKTSIFDAEKATLYQFNSSASFIFVRLKKGLSIDVITKSFVKEFAVPEQVARQDISNFINSLLEKGVAVRA